MGELKSHGGRQKKRERIKKLLEAYGLAPPTDT